MVQLGEIQERAKIKVEVPIVDDDETGDYASESREVSISWRFLLAAGLVDAGRAHPDARRWFKPATRPTTRRAVSRLPLVVTCWKGHETLINAPDVSAYASGSDEVRMDQLARTLELEAREDAAQAWGDLMDENHRNGG